MSNQGTVTEPYARFYKVEGVEVVTLLASDYRSFMEKQSEEISSLQHDLDEIHARGYVGLYADELRKTGHTPWMHGTDSQTCWCHDKS